MDPLLPGDPGEVGSYRLLGRLGMGGMGVVFLGRSPGGRRVAVKLVRPEHARDARFRARFAREVQAARRVGGFHTAQVVDADPDADPPWMVTAYIPGQSLGASVAAQGPFGVPGVCALGAGLAEGLAAVHACGLIHRDLKPGNVILGPDGPQLIDFGIARALDASTMTSTEAVIGTYAYMSPEQVQGEPVVPASDVFSLGSVLAFAATGRSPFEGGPPGAVLHRIASGTPDLSPVPTEHGLRALVAECLAKNPAKRPTLADLVVRLASHATDGVWPRTTAPGAVTSTTDSSTAPATLVRPARTMMFRGGPGREGHYELGERSPSWMPWTRDLNAASSPIAPAVVDGTVYVGGLALEALDATTGRLRWLLNRGVATSPAVAGGVVFAHSGFHVLAASAKSGQVRWMTEIGSSTSSPAVLGGRVFICTEKRFLHALDAATGALLWKTMIGECNFRASPAAAGTTVYAAGKDGDLYALDVVTGRPTWRAALGEPIFATTIAVARGTVYVSTSYALHALDAATGQRRWRVHTGLISDSSPAVSDATVYIIGPGGFVHALSAATGAVRWRVKVGDRCSGASAAIAGNRLYVPDRQGWVHSLDVDTGRFIWATALGAFDRPSPAIAAGVLYLGTADGRLHALDARTGERPSNTFSL